jgi:hypothetical protein
MGAVVHHSKVGPLRSAMGHEQTLRLIQSMSALTPKADIETPLIHQLVVRNRQGLIPLFCGGTFFRKTSVESKSISALVPVGGATLTRLPNSLSCPTFTERHVESQCVFSRLSHRLLASRRICFTPESGLIAIVPGVSFSHNSCRKYLGCCDTIQAALL